MSGPKRFASPGAPSLALWCHRQADRREEREKEEGGENRAKNEINERDKEEAAQLKVSLGHANCFVHHFHRL